MKTIFLLLLAVPCLASGPKYVGTTTDPNVYQEFVNVYHDISNPAVNNGISSTMTITNLIGTKTNDNALSGNVGEYISSFASATGFPTSLQYGDLTSISLTAGDWDVVGQMTAALNGATMTEWEFAITPTSGNNTTGMVNGDNQMRAPVPTTNYQTGGFLYIRVSIASTTTYYLKYFSNYPSGTPQAQGKIAARRVR